MKVSINSHLNQKTTDDGWKVDCFMKLRHWLLVILAGKRTIVINAKFNKDNHLQISSKVNSNLIHSCENIKIIQY
jgi:hypothetical protein